MQTERVTLDTLGCGAARELFQAELDRVVENIVDPNTNPTKARKVVLELKLKPNKDRTLCHAEISCKSTLAEAVGYETQVMVGIDRGKPVASELVQGALFDAEKEGANA